MTELISLQNPRIKRIVRLREKRARQQEGLMLVEGAYELELALAGGLPVRELYRCPELGVDATPALLALEAVTVSRPVFEKMSYRENPDGWLAVMPLPRNTLETLHPAEPPLLVLAEAVEKPGNLGAILRTADAAGVDGLLVCDPGVDTYNPNVVRASRGTLFTLPVVETTAEAALAWLRAAGIRLVASTPAARLSYAEADLSQPVCIAVGAEDDGLSDFWLGQADLRVSIPMRGRVNSLNVSTSTAVLLYEADRQRRAAGGRAG